MTRYTIAILVIGVPIVLGLHYVAAMAGSPQSRWMMCDILRMCQ